MHPAVPGVLGEGEMLMAGQYLIDTRVRKQ